MKAVHASLLVLSLVLIGCDRESPRGGPGANGPTKSEVRSETFTVEVPGGGTNVTQGKREEVSISIDRGSNFKQPVKLTFEAPKGLKVVPSSATIKSGDSKTNVFVEAADDATVGRHRINVTGTPESGGKATSIAMDIDVKKRD